MYKRRLLLILFIILIFILLFPAIIQAGDIMSVAEIEPGMRGIGKTVFSGTQIDEFKVEIIDILEDTGLNERLILIRTGGPRIEEIGGIAAGMSGSPVFIDGKLIGAIGYGWGDADSRYALVTPIEEMLELFANLPAEQDKSGGVPGEGTRLRTPLMISGIDGRALDYLRKELSTLNLKIYPGKGPGGEMAGEIEIPEPGSAVAVQLARGDINVASIGTVTYVEDDRILAFGHPFTNRGEVNYLLSNAHINAVIPSRNQPFKLGAPGSELIGSIVSDRGAGIVGRLRKYPPIIPLNVTIRDENRDIKNNVRTQIVRDELLFTSLGSSILLQSIDETLDRIGKGTARVKIMIMGNGLPDLEVERVNMYSSRRDIAARSIADFYQLLNIIFSNPFKEINVIDIAVEVDIVKEERVALVQSAKILNETVKPGDKLDIEVTLHPYRREPFVKQVSLQLPEDINTGMTSVVIEGGAMGAAYSQLPEEDLEDENYEVKEAQIAGYKSFQEMIADFTEQPANNDLVLQVYRGYPVAAPRTPPEKQQDEGEKEEEEAQTAQMKIEKEKEKAEIKNVESTDYVLEGSLTLDINVEDTAETTDKQGNDPGENSN